MLQYSVQAEINTWGENVKKKGQESELERKLSISLEAVFVGRSSLQ